VSTAPHSGSSGPRAWAAFDLNQRTPEHDRPLTFKYVSPGRERTARPGDTAGLAADASGAFYVLWVDDRTGVHQVWTAPVTASDYKTTPMRDVTDSVRVEFAATRDDTTSKTVSVDVRITSAAASPLRGPFVLDVLSAAADTAAGGAVVLNADNHRDGAGATWRFVTPNDAPLERGKSTAPRTLQFKYPGELALYRDPVNMRVRVLAPVAR
jgi:hypothetical protein